MGCHGTQNIHRDSSAAFFSRIADLEVFTESTMDFRVSAVKVMAEMVMDRCSIRLLDVSTLDIQTPNGFGGMTGPQKHTIQTPS